MRSTSVMYVAMVALVSGTLAAAVRDVVGDEESQLDNAFKARRGFENGEDFMNVPQATYNYHVNQVPAIPHGSRVGALKVYALSGKGFPNRITPPDMSMPVRAPITSLKPLKKLNPEKEPLKSTNSPSDEPSDAALSDESVDLLADEPFNDPLAEDATDPLEDEIDPRMDELSPELKQRLTDELQVELKGELGAGEEPEIEWNLRDSVRPVEDDKSELSELPLAPIAPQAHTQEKNDNTLESVNSMADVYFLAVVTGCSIAGVVGLIVAGVCWYRLQKNVKAASDVDYPAYGITGPTKERLPSPSDRKLAQSAQMYHYQHQKQQMIAMEKAQEGDLHKEGSDVDSEEENEEGDYTVFECPGLAPTGEMEVKNPLFSEDTPVTPSAPSADQQQHK